MLKRKNAGKKRTYILIFISFPRKILIEPKFPQNKTACYEFCRSAVNAYEKIVPQASECFLKKDINKKINDLNEL
jgi:hypothetical protein